MEPQPSRRTRILEAFVARIEAIQQGETFETNAGANVELGFVPEYGPDDPDVGIAIIGGLEQPTFQGEHVAVFWPVEIHAVAKASLSEPWIAVEQVIADIKRAVELPDRTLGGLVKKFMERGVVQAVPREPGSTTVGAVVPYLVRFAEVWGDPS